MAAKRPVNPSASLPTGTVTLLFTDIEGSTQLWEAQQQAMGAALARHDQLLRYSIGARGGHVFKTVGDAFCAAFHTASDGLAAALEAQRALHNERWPAPVKLRVRMALHIGAVELRDGDYFGAPLNRVSRLLAVGHGGQTLLSESMHDLCRDHLPPLASVKPLGEHGLKDLARREAVFQLCHPDLPQAFPPLKSQNVPMDKETPSIAVLPFVNMSRDEENEYFADGLAEELLNVLSKIRGLRVASRTSAFSFKGKDVDIPTVAQKLNVATILEGSVRKSGKRVRVTAQLVEAATDSHLWSESYDRELEDIFAVQDDIAQSVVKELRLALLGETSGASANAAVKAEVQAAAKGRGENAEAYRLYLQGRFFEDRLTREDTAKGIDYYLQALKLDPENAMSWAGLSRAYSNQAGYAWTGFAEGFGKAKEAAERALRSEPDLAEAHAALGLIRMTHDWDWAGADAALRRALELAPGNAQVLRNAGMLASTLGRGDEGLQLFRRAAAIDPLSAPAHRFLGVACLGAGLLEDAEAAMTKMLELDNQGGLVHFYLGIVLLAQSRLDEALAAFKRENIVTFRLLGLALVQHALGRPTESDAALRELIAWDADGSAYQIAEAHAYRGEFDGAFEWLERAFVQRDPGVVMMKASWLLNSLHRDPRWQPLLEKMSLAD